MTRSAASAAAHAAEPRRLVLVPVGTRPDELVRRYRLARLSVEPPARTTREERFAHLRRTYD